MINPGYCRNAEKIEDRFNSFSQAEASGGKSGGKPGMSAAERAASLANRGTPAVGNSIDSDDEDDKDDDDDTSFGIIPKNRLQPDEDARQSMTGF